MGGDGDSAQCSLGGWKPAEGADGANAGGSVAKAARTPAWEVAARTCGQLLPLQVRSRGSRGPSDGGRAGMRRTEPRGAVGRRGNAGRSVCGGVGDQELSSGRGVSDATYALRGDVRRASGLARLLTGAVPGAGDADEGGGHGHGPRADWRGHSGVTAAGKGTGTLRRAAHVGSAAIRAQGAGEELGRGLGSLRGVTETHGMQTRATATDCDQERLGTRRWNWSRRPATLTRAASAVRVRGVLG